MIILKSDKITGRCTRFVFTLINFAGLLFVVLIILGLGYEVWDICLREIFGAKDIEHATASHEGLANKFLGFIELFFLVPLPILITTSIFGYYRKVLSNNYGDDPLEETNNTALNYIQASIELSMTKYNFFAILISTGFIAMIRSISSGGSEIDFNKLVLYAFVLISIISMLFYIFKLKHSIVENSLKLYAEKDRLKVNMELEKMQQYVKEVTALSLTLAQELENTESKRNEGLVLLADIENKIKLKQEELDKLNIALVEAGEKK